MNDSRQSTSEVINFPQGGSDAMESAARAAFDAIRRAAANAEQKNQVALGLAHKTALQLRAAEERIAQLEAEVEHAWARAQKAEQWLHKIVAEIEQRFEDKSEHRDEWPRQTGAEACAPTGAEVYAPKKRKQREEVLKGLGDLVHARSLTG